MSDIDDDNDPGNFDSSSPSGSIKSEGDPWTNHPDYNPDYNDDDLNSSLPSQPRMPMPMPSQSFIYLN
jgi:hypothetical protein